MAETDIQQLLDNPDSTGVVTLPSGEFEGRFVIRKSCTVNGNNTVLWNSSGPVLMIDADNVSINGVDIELTDDNIPPEQHISVYCRYPGVKFDRVGVNGAVMGIEGEEQYWGMPRVLDLGSLAAEKSESFSFEIYAPVDAEICCDFHDVQLSESVLKAGYNTIALTVDKIRGGALIYGNILVKSAVERKIILSGAVVSEGESEQRNYMLYSVDREAPAKYREMLEKLDMVQLATMAPPKREEVTMELEEINENEDEMLTADNEDVEIFSGKRIPLAPKKYKIEFEYLMSKMDLDIDAYVFMLNDSGKVSKNSHMIFFGNDHSDCGSVQYLNAPDKRAMYIDFGHIPTEVNHMVLLYSIYGTNPMQSFDKLTAPQVSVLCENGVNMHLRLENGINCRTLLALGFERTEGVWEMIPSGRAVGMKLEDICRSYGVEIV